MRGRRARCGRGCRVFGIGGSADGAAQAVVLAQPLTNMDELLTEALLGVLCGEDALRPLLRRPAMALATGHKAADLKRDVRETAAAEAQCDYPIPKGSLFAEHVWRQVRGWLRDIPQIGSQRRDDALTQKLQKLHVTAGGSPQAFARAGGPPRPVVSAGGPPQATARCSGRPCRRSSRKGRAMAATQKRHMAMRAMMRQDVAWATRAAGARQGPPLMLRRWPLLTTGSSITSPVARSTERRRRPPTTSNSQRPRCRANCLRPPRPPSWAHHGPRLQVCRTPAVRKIACRRITAAARARRRSRMCAKFSLRMCLALCRLLGRSSSGRSLGPAPHSRGHRCATPRRTGAACLRPGAD